MFRLSRKRSTTTVAETRQCAPPSLFCEQTQYPEIWDLIEAQLDQKLKSTKGDVEVQLMYVACCLR
jgi:hypothetical protein